MLEKCMVNNCSYNKVSLSVPISSPIAATMRRSPPTEDTLKRGKVCVYFNSLISILVRSNNCDTSSI